MFKMNKMFLIILLTLTFSLPVSAGWSDWENLGETNYSTPSACTAGNWTFVFTLNSRRQVVYRKRWLPTGDWSDWKAVPSMSVGDQSTMASATPAIYCMQDANFIRVAVHVVGFDQRIWNTIGIITNKASDIWDTWIINKDFITALHSGIAIASLNGYQSHLFAIGRDNKMYVQAIGDTGFQLLVPEHITYDPTAVWSSKDRLELFYRDSNGQIWHQYKKNNVWSNRQPIQAGETFGSLSVVSRNSTTLDLFTKGPGNTLNYKSFVNGEWSIWINMGGELFSSPGATVYAGNTRLMVFGSWKSDGTLRYRTWSP